MVNSKLSNSNPLFLNVRALSDVQYITRILNFLSAQHKVIATGSNKPATVKQFAFSGHFPNLFYLAGHLVCCSLLTLWGPRYFYPSRRHRSSVAIHQGTEKIGGWYLYLCFVPIYIFPRLVVQEYGDSFPKSLAV